MEEKVYPDNHKPVAKSGSKKTLFIILGVLLITCICCVATVGGMVVLGGGILGAETKEIQTVLYEVCDAGDISSMKDADQWFTNSFQSENSQDDAAELLAEAFPSSFDCSELQGDGLLDSVLSGHSVYVSTNNGITTGEYSFDNGDAYVTFYMRKLNDTWVIDEIDL